MKRWIPAILLMAALLAAACGWHPRGYRDTTTTADWEDYDYVFEARAPAAYYPVTYLKLNVASDGTASGEVQTIFWAQFTGALAGENLTLQMAFEDSFCETTDSSHATFAGQLAARALTGQFAVQSCDWYDFEFDGKLVGGRKWSPADAENTP